MRQDQEYPEGDALDAADGDGQGDGQQARGLGWSGWLVSASFHGLLLAVLGTVYFLVNHEVDEAPPLRLTTLEPPEKRPEQPKVDRAIDTKVPLEITAEREVANPITDQEVTVEKTTSEDEVEATVAKGREEAVSDAEMGGVGAFMTIGVGGPSKGIFGDRRGGGRLRAVGENGGNHGSESAVNAGLRWLKRHQSPNGMWDAVNYPGNCTEAGPKCEPGALAAGDTNVAMTAYAVLCFLGAGYDHRNGTYARTVHRGIDYLRSVQKPDGLLGERNYEHAIATMALAEAYAMSSDESLREPAQKGVDAILARQNHDAKAVDAAYAGLGWDYTAAKERNDSSVTGWNVMALKSAFAGGLTIGDGMVGAKTWLEKAWKATNPDWQKLDPYGESRFPYTWDSASDKVQIAQGPSMQAHDLACVGMVAGVFLGHHAGDVMLETLANYVMKHQMPTAWPTNTYYMYYNTLGIFQVGGERWKQWNGSVRDLLVNAQRKGGGCFDGSWDWQGGTNDWHGSEVGRVLHTCYGILCLEVYYRYAQVAGHRM